MHSLYQIYGLLYNLNNPLVNIHHQFIGNITDDYLKLYSVNLTHELTYLGPTVANMLHDQFETQYDTARTSLIAKNILNLPAKSVCVLLETEIKSIINARGFDFINAQPDVSACDLIINKHRIWAHRIIYCVVTITYIGLLSLSGWLN